MEFDTITIEPIVLNWWLICIPIYVVAVGVIGLTVFTYLIPYYALQIASIITSSIALVLTVLVLIIVPDMITTPLRGDHQAAALEQQLGFTHVKVDSERDVESLFTASTADGQYVGGKLVEINRDMYVLVLEK